jgi:hypothetical protein
VLLVLQEQLARQVCKAHPVSMASLARQAQELQDLRAIPVQVAELLVLQVRVV